MPWDKPPTSKCTGVHNLHVTVKLSVKAYWSVNKWYINISKVRFILQIYSSEWVLFTVLIFFLKKFCAPFLWMGLDCLKAIEPLRGDTLLLTTKLPSILSFPKKLLPTIFQFLRIDSKVWCDVFCDLVPFVQFKKREKHSWKSVTFGKSNTPPQVFFMF